MVQATAKRDIYHWREPPFSRNTTTQHLLFAPHETPHVKSAAPFTPNHHRSGISPRKEKDEQLKGCFFVPLLPSTRIALFYVLPFINGLFFTSEILCAASSRVSCDLIHHHKSDSWIRNNNDNREGESTGRDLEWLWTRSVPWGLSEKKRKPGEAIE